ncbi:Tfp pilus assembly protein PilV [Streptococcus pneumoniae]|nr:Tfp pilus assembly protein PilV [Streptococcus pneumoniae]
MRRKVEGFGLIEVLVSMLILGVGILGMIGLQLNALQYNQTAAFRSHATFLAYDIADRMRANAPAALAGSYSTDLTDGAPTGGGIVDTDLREWKTAMASQLPAGNGSVSKNGDIYSITVQWDESKTGGEATQQFVFTTRLCERDCL